MFFFIEIELCAQRPALCFKKIFYPHVPLNPTKCFFKLWMFNLRGEGFMQLSLDFLNFILLLSPSLTHGSCCVTCMALCLRGVDRVEGHSGGVVGASREFIMLSPCYSLHTDVVQDCGVQMIFPWGDVVHIQTPTLSFSLSHTHLCIPTHTHTHSYTCMHRNPIHFIRQNLYQSPRQWKLKSIFWLSVVLSSLKCEIGS